MQEPERDCLQRENERLRADRDRAFSLIYELFRDEHFIHGRDSWFERAHELCGDLCNPPNMHSFNSDTAEVCQCGLRNADMTPAEPQEPEPEGEMSESCLWIESSDGEMWETECGNGFVLNDGTPQNNCMLYCCYCGKSLGQTTAVQRPSPAPTDRENENG